VGFFKFYDDRRRKYLHWRWTFFNEWYAFSNVYFCF
jgi:hypothetical protein